MGDSGSLFIGLNLSILTLTSPSSTQAPTSLLAIMAAPVMTLMVPILDTTLVTTSRLLSGRSAAQGGRDHSSHRLVAIGLSERTAVFVLWGLSALGGAVGLALQHYRTDLPGLVAALLFLAVIIFAVFLARVRVYEDSDEVMTRKDRLTPLVVNFVFRRRIAEVFLDLCLVPIAYYAAYRLRFDRLEFGRHFPRFLETLPLIVGVQLVSLAVVGGYRGVWQYFGLMDGVTFAKGVGLATLVNVLLVIASGRFEPYFVSIFVVFAALLMLMLAGSRASFRLISEFANRRNQSGTRVLIYGDGDVGASAARDILGRRLGGYRMLGFIVTDPTLERTRMQGYPVLGGLPALISLIEAAAVDLIVITQALGEDVEAEIRAACSTHGVALERLHITLEPVESPVIRT
jgi:UDP-GlcNAc:undecaprenyl-phosphate GlcNAc-1-phosphate transferase